MMLAKTEIPISWIPISPATNRLAITPTSPIVPRIMLIPPKRLPKSGALSMATPRTMKQITMKRLPTKKNVAVIPCVVCHKRTAVACVSAVTAGAQLRSEIGVKAKNVDASPSAVEM